MEASDEKELMEDKGCSVLGKVVEEPDQA